MREDIETSPRAAPEEAARDVPEDEGREEPPREAVEPTDADQDALPEDNEPPVRHSCADRNPEGHEPMADAGPDQDNESETDQDQTTVPPQDSRISSDEPPLTRGERDVDRVIGILLGEPRETPQQTDESTQEQETEAVAQEQESPAEAQPQEQQAEPQPEFVPTVESVLEAILFATDEPLTDNKLAGIVETTAKQVRESIENLNAKYTTENHAFRIEQIAGGYQMLTLNTYNHWLKKMLRVRSDNKLSPAAMETLAIIAYKQPIIRADIEAIRGVAVGEVIRSLMYKGLVKIAGRAEILGRPMLYGTTKKFLEVFGLNSIKDLPKAEELKNPDRA
jgi:segregation and condensation protein B